MPKAKTSLNELLHEIRRIEESRKVLTDKKIKKLYRQLTKELTAFIGEAYTKYADESGVLTVAQLQEKAKLAWFLNELDKNCNKYLPAISSEIQELIEKVYEKCYTGMIEATNKAYDFSELKVRPEVMKAAIANNITKLTLPELLEKNRKEVIYEIKQTIDIGLMNGDRYETMSRKLVERLDISYGKANNIVRTETHRNIEGGIMDGALETAKALEGSGLIHTATWRTMKDERVRPQQRRKKGGRWTTTLSRNGANHIKMDGVTIQVGDKFKLEPDVYAISPSRSGTARNDCNCRCFLEYDLLTVEEWGELQNKQINFLKKPVQTDTTKTDNYDYWIKEVPDDYEELSTAWGKYVSKDITDKEYEDIYSTYIGNTRSRDINGILRANPTLSIEEALEERETMLRAATSLHNVIQKNTIPQNVLLTRNLNHSYTEKVFGLNPSQIDDICNNFNNNEVQKALKAFNGTEIREMSFVSCSANPKLNVFENSPIRLELKVNKGYSAFVSEIVDESEVILDRGTAYVIEGFDVVTEYKNDQDIIGQKILKIKARVK